MFRVVFFLQFFWTLGYFFNNRVIRKCLCNFCVNDTFFLLIKLSLISYTIGRMIDKREKQIPIPEKPVSQPSSGRPLMELPEGWTEGLYRKFISAVTQEEQFAFAQELENEQKMHAEIKTFTKYELSELRWDCLRKCIEIGNVFRQQQKELEEQVKTLRNDPTYLSVEDNKRIMESCQYELSLPSGSSARIKDYKVQLEGLNAKISSLVEPKKPGWFALEKTIQTYESFSTERDRLLKRSEVVKGLLAKEEAELEQQRNILLEKIKILDQKYKTGVAQPEYQDVIKRMNLLREQLSQLQKPEELSLFLDLIESTYSEDSFDDLMTDAGGNEERAINIVLDREYRLTKSPLA